MSDRLGPQQLGTQNGEVFLGRDYGHEATYSDEVAGLIDDEVRRLVDGAHDRARAILTTHRATLDRLAAALVEKETLDDADLAEVFGDIDKGVGLKNHVPSPPARRPAAPASPVGVAVADAEVADEPVPALVPLRQVVRSLPRRLSRRRAVRAPRTARPSGT